MTLSEQPSKDRLKIIVYHSGHENDTCYTENIFEFLSKNGVDHDSRVLSEPFSLQELAAYRDGCHSTSLLGFNSQIDHSWIGDAPLTLAAGRHGIPVLQWILDHPSSRWPEFGFLSTGWRVGDEIPGCRFVERRLSSRCRGG